VRARLSEVLGLARTNFPIVNDPQSTCWVLVRKRLKETARNAENGGFVLSRNTKNDDSWMRAGRVLSNVGEVRIKRHEYSIFGFTDRRDCLIRIAPRP
jgi:hypothetical protein